MEILAGLSVATLGIIGAIVVALLITFFIGRSYAGFIVVSAIALILSQWTTVPIITILYENLFTTIKYGVGYILLGILWTLVAWYILVHKHAARYADIRAKLLPEFLNAVHAQSLTPDLFEAFRQYVYKNGHISAKYQSPSTGLMVSNILFWPFAIIEFVLGDALTALARAIRGLFGNVYQRIHRHAFRKFDEIA